jgi:hypothetical protein
MPYRYSRTRHRRWRTASYGWFKAMAIASLIGLASALLCAVVLNLAG